MERSIKIVAIVFAALALTDQGGNAHGQLLSSDGEISRLSSAPPSEITDFKSQFPLLTVGTHDRAAAPSHSIQPTAQGMVGLGFVALIGVLGLRRKRQG